MLFGNGIRPLHLGLTLGIVWGFGVFFMGLMAALFSYGVPFVELMSSFYLGFDATVSGAFLGLAWGFADGLIGGCIVAWIYNKVGTWLK